MSGTHSLDYARLSRGPAVTPMSIRIDLELRER